jgi:hypothetical protein
MVLNKRIHGKLSCWTTVDGTVTTSNRDDNTAGLVSALEKRKK